MEGEPQHAGRRPHLTEQHAAEGVFRCGTGFPGEAGAVAEVALRGPQRPHPQPGEFLVAGRVGRIGEGDALVAGSDVARVRTHNGLTRLEWV